MARPTFSPDDQQRRALDHIAALVDNRARLDELIAAAIREADQLGIPKKTIAERLGVQRKTVYRHLGR